MRQRVPRPRRRRLALFAGGSVLNNPSRGTNFGPAAGRGFGRRSRDEPASVTSREGARNWCPAHSARDSNQLGSARQACRSDSAGITDLQAAVFEGHPFLRGLGVITPGNRLDRDKLEVEAKKTVRRPGCTSLTYRNREGFYRSGNASVCRDWVVELRGFEPLTSAVRERTRP